MKACRAVDGVGEGYAIALVIFNNAEVELVADLDIDQREDDKGDPQACDPCGQSLGARPREFAAFS